MSCTRIRNYSCELTERVWSKIALMNDKLISLRGNVLISPQFHYLLPNPRTLDSQIQTMQYEDISVILE